MSEIVSLQSSCLSLTLRKAYIECLSSCLSLTLLKAYIECLSSCLFLTLLKAYIEGLSSCLSLTLLKAYIECLSSCLSLTLLKAYIECLSTRFGMQRFPTMIRPLRFARETANSKSMMLLSLCRMRLYTLYYKRLMLVFCQRILGKVK